MKTLSPYLQGRMLDMLRRIADLNTTVTGIDEIWKLQIEIERLIRAAESEYEAQS